MSARVLVTGGAGYVGSHVLRALRGAGHEVLVLDDLSTGHRDAVGDAPLVVGDVGDAPLLERVLDGTVDGGAPVGAVVHLAARCLVGESVRDPAGYYESNLRRPLRLLAAGARRGVRAFVLSSSAAVYGEARALPIEETHPTRPTNPYGETKLAFERALHWARGAGGPRWCALRYFNAAGAADDGSLGEHHANETHLVPRLIRSALGQDPAPVEILGDDWPTPDGTCVRDFVHVDDLAAAHVSALARLLAGDADAEGPINLGSGRGTSVREAIDAVGAACGRPPRVRAAARRPGDPPALVASNARAARVLGWSPRSGLRAIVESAARWHRARPDGFDAAPRRG